MITVISYTVSKNQVSIIQKLPPLKPKRFPYNFLAHNSRYLMQNKITPAKIKKKVFVHELIIIGTFIATYFLKKKCKNFDEKKVLKNRLF